MENQLHFSSEVFQIQCIVRRSSDAIKSSSCCLILTKEPFKSQKSLKIKASVVLSCSRFLIATRACGNQKHRLKQSIVCIKCIMTPIETDTQHLVLFYTLPAISKKSKRQLDCNNLFLSIMMGMSFGLPIIYQ